MTPTLDCCKGETCPECHSIASNLHSTAAGRGRTAWHSTAQWQYKVAQHGTARCQNMVPQHMCNAVKGYTCSYRLVHLASLLVVQQQAYLIIARQAPRVPGFRLLKPHVINPSTCAGVGHNIVMVTCRKPPHHTRMQTFCQHSKSTSAGQIRVQY